MAEKNYFNRLYLIEKGKQYIVFDEDGNTQLYPMGQILCECALLDVYEVIEDILTYENFDDSASEGNIKNAFQYYINLFENKYLFAQAYLLKVVINNFIIEYFKEITKEQKTEETNERLQLVSIIENDINKKIEKKEDQIKEHKEEKSELENGTNDGNDSKKISDYEELINKLEKELSCLLRCKEVIEQINERESFDNETVGNVFLFAMSYYNLSHTELVKSRDELTEEAFSNYVVETVNEEDNDFKCRFQMKRSIVEQDIKSYYTLVNDIIKDRPANKNIKLDGVQIIK